MTMIANVIASMGYYFSYWIIAITLAYAWFDKRMRARQRNPNRLPLPPGPKGLPLLGSVLDMPRDQSWLVYDNWSKIYGDMVYFEVLGQPFLILSYLKRTGDLFDRRSSNYSDRPRMPMLVELMDWTYNMAFMPYHQWWRRHRKLFHHHFHQNVVWKYQPIQQRETRVFLYRLLTAPEDFLHSSRQKAARWKALLPGVVQKPFNHVEDRLRKGDTSPSMAATVIERLPDFDDPLYTEEKLIGMNATSLAYLAGADTTMSAVHAFFLAMVLYPDVQIKAQAELDAVVEKNRLPDFNDYDSLPYIIAIAKETMRWHLVTPLAIAHMCSQDDEYDGFFIPRGTIVMGNAWSILHDPKVFPNPSAFQPERFLKDGKLNPDARDPDCAAFGFGRRICPGRHMSNNSLYSVISSVLAVYDITPPLDNLGNPIEVKPEFSSGFLSYIVIGFNMINILRWRTLVSAIRTVFLDLEAALVPGAVQTPFNHVEDRLNKGNSSPMAATAVIERLPNPSDPFYADEKAMARMPRLLPTSDTTLSAVHTLLDMVLYADVQRKAQAEIDRVVGPKRLPVSSDYDSLPHINDLTKETMRWHLVIPLGMVNDFWTNNDSDCSSAVVHMCSQDDGYDDFFIPWGTYRNGKCMFQPERFLKDGKLDPNARNPDCAAFGFGRRMDWTFSMAFMPYGQWWRRHRKAFNQHFHQNAVWRYKPTQQREVRVFLQCLLNAPEDFMRSSRHMFAATIMKEVYGITVKNASDPYITSAEKALTALAYAGVPGRFLVDVIPALKYIPSWFPGARFKKKAAQWKEVNPEVVEKPFRHVETKLKDGDVPSSMAATLIERLPDRNDPLYAEEKTISQNAACLAFLGGADTTLSAVHIFFLAMVLYPEVQRKAQAELDAVIGHNRLPEFNDYDSLPYVNALVKETMRWHLVTPLAIAHRCSQDDEYDGFFIPRGTIVMGNAWSILHDQDVFPNPSEFQPERFLKDGKLDPNARNPDCAAFGFGRRICPGRHFSNNSLYSIISSVLAVYNITPSLDDLGNPMEVKPEFSSGLLSPYVAASSFKSLLHNFHGTHLWRKPRQGNLKVIMYVRHLYLYNCPRLVQDFFTTNVCVLCPCSFK
ncbi:hypothetical protein CVT25_006529 [Psilocybe cyanescens]|uniref:Cytochrome P450 n=1 Tax=Psilocybe cyanescens TaxID=93625 RepID=A0A409XEU2_PSICY|nr:hypothetical protein CVT25_006529 [Psilocybe cyanescens]